jgi:hypothetical protein
MAEAEAAASQDAKAQAAPVTATGLGKAAATGTRGGLEGLVSAPGDLVTWESRKAAQLAQYLGASPETVQSIQNYFTKPTRGPGVATTPDVQAATDAAVTKVLPKSISGPVQDVTRHQPQNKAEEWAQTGGSFLPSALLPGSLATRATRVLIPTAAVEGTGQVTRQLAPEYEDAARLVAGFLSGGGLKGGAEPGGFRFRSNLRKLADVGPKGVERVKQLLTEQGMSPEDAVAATKQLGPEGRVLDTGPNVRQEAQQIQAAGGEGRGILDPMLRAREEGKNRRLMEDVGATVGPQEHPTAVVQALEDRASRVGQQYPAAKSNQTRPAGLDGIAHDLDAEIANARGGTQSKLQKIRDMLDRPGAKGNLDPSSEGVHAMRQEIDRMIKKEKPGTPVYARLNEYRQRIDSELKDIAPDIKSLDEQYSAIKDEGRAFEKGQQIYENPRGTDPADFQQTWDAMTPGEQAHVLKGMNTETYRQLGISGKNLSELQKLISGEGKWNQAKVATVIGEEKAQQLMDAISREKTFNESYNKIVQGSKTAESSRSPSQRSFGQAAGDTVKDMLFAAGAGGGWAGAGGAAFSNIRRFVGERMKGGGQSAALDADVARLLSSDRPEDLLKALRMVEQHQSHSVPGAVLGALLARQQDQGAQR